MRTRMIVLRFSGSAASVHRHRLVVNIGGGRLNTKQTVRTIDINIKLYVSTGKNLSKLCRRLLCFLLSWQWSLFFLKIICRGVDTDRNYWILLLCFFALSRSLDLDHVLKLFTAGGSFWIMFRFNFCCSITNSSLCHNRRLQSIVYQESLGTKHSEKWLLITDVHAE